MTGQEVNRERRRGGEIHHANNALKSGPGYDAAAVGALISANIVGAQPTAQATLQAQDR